MLNRSYSIRVSVNKNILIRGTKWQPSFNYAQTQAHFQSALSNPHQPKSLEVKSMENQSSAQPLSSGCNTVKRVASTRARAKVRPNVNNAGGIALVDDTIPSATGPALCEEQRNLVNLISEGYNVFYTGCAGTGKSTVLQAFVKKLVEDGKNVNIVAPTGRAALDINGSTTWTFAGWTPNDMKKPLSEILKEALDNRSVRKRLRRTDVLVIDEISMVENNYFDRLNMLLQEVRDDRKPFGGVQLVVTGDFCQLPPVKPFQFCYHCGKELRANRDNTTYTCPEHGVYRDEDKWAFRSKVWAQCNFEHVYLKQIHRQSDEAFINILNKCRLGLPFSAEDHELLNSHDHDTKNAVKLFSTRDEVRRTNEAEFKRLKSRKVTYHSFDNFRWNPEHRHIVSKGLRSPDGTLRALAEHRFDSQVHLKVGMLVILLANLDLEQGLVNGSQGVVRGFTAFQRGDEDEIVLRTRRGDPDSYASFRAGNVREFMEKARKKKWPVVQFDNGQTIPILCDSTINELGDEKPYSLISRTQIPLLPAWAISIHKSQGMTLNKVIVDISKVFEDGQMYVALSRARSLKGLEVLGLTSSTSNRGNLQVKEFLESNFDL